MHETLLLGPHGAPRILEVPVMAVVVAALVLGNRFALFALTLYTA